MCEHHLSPSKSGIQRSYSYDASARLLEIVTSGVSSFYEVLPLEGDHPEYRLVKEGVTGEHYDVLINRDNPRHDLCTCPAGRWGRACKHVAALRHWLVNCASRPVRDEA